MALWCWRGYLEPRRTGRGNDRDKRGNDPAAVDAPNAATLTVPTWADFIGIINEETAKGVPAFLRALRLISGTIANMPLVAYRGAAPSPDQPRLLRQPEPDVPRWNTLENTVEDLVLYGGPIGKS